MRSSYSLWFFFVFTVLLCPFVSAQQKGVYHDGIHRFNTTVIYDLRYQPDTSNAERLLEETFELLWSDSLSLFRSQNRGLLDSSERVRMLWKGETHSVLRRWQTLTHTIPDFILLSLSI